MHFTYAYISALQYEHVKQCWAKVEICTAAVKAILRCFDADSDVMDTRNEYSSPPILKIEHTKYTQHDLSAALIATAAALGRESVSWIVQET